MAILDLDKIIINRTVIGITCSACGGNLNPTHQNQLAEKLINVVTLGKINAHQYECSNCKRHYMLIGSGSK